MVPGSVVDIVLGNGSCSGVSAEALLGPLSSLGPLLDWGWGWLMLGAETGKGPVKWGG